MTNRAPRAARTRRQRILLWSGLLLIGAGVACLAWLGWQLFVTTWLSKRDQAETVTATQQVWRAERLGKQASEDDQELAEGVVALVRIPAISDDYVPVRDGVDDDVLSRGFGLFDTSPKPGGVGNYALAGHRITHGEPLRDMPDLEPGDEVEVLTRTTEYTYTLDTSGDGLNVGMDEGWVTEPSPVNPDGGIRIRDLAGSRRLLTLVTCAELFHTDDRLVAFGHLTAQRPAGTS